MSSELFKLIALFDNQAAMANAFNVSENAVTKWAKKGYLPTGRAMQAINIIQKLGIEHDVTLQGLLKEYQDKKKDNKPDRES